MIDHRNDRHFLIAAILCFAVAGMLWAAMTFGATTTPRVLQVVYTSPPDGGWRIEVADYAEPTHFELWSTRVSPPGPRIRISTP